MRAAAVADERRAPVDDALEQVRAQPSMEGQALVAAVSTPRAVRLQRRRARARRGRRLRRQALDPAPARGGRRRGHGLPARRRRRTSSPASTASLLSNGPGDPEPLVDGDRGRPRAARPRAACSGSASATSCSGSRPGTRRTSSRSATAARTTRCSSARTGRVLVTSQNHGFAVAPSEDARGDARLALRRHGRGLRLPRAARALGAVPSRGRARARTTPGRSSSAGSRSCAR